WTLYLLARAPKWQERVAAEIDTVVGDRPVEAQHLNRLVVTRMVLKEAMRLYPPVPLMTRIATQTMVLGPATVPAGALMVIPVYVLHRHRKLWDDPDRFDPERFAPEREACPRAQFMPFGFGPRTCIGGSFAMLEMTAVLATLLRSAFFAWDGVHAPEPLARVALRPKGGMPLRVWLRN